MANKAVLMADSGGVGISGCLSNMKSLSESLTNLKEELDSTIFSDSNYAVSKLADKVTDAINELNKARVSLNNSYAKYKNNS